jgi:hypothetical protein
MTARASPAWACTASLSVVNFPWWNRAGLPAAPQSRLVRLLLAKNPSEVRGGNACSDQRLTVRVEGPLVMSCSSKSV